MRSHYHITNNNQKIISVAKCHIITPNDYESKPHGWIFYIFEQPLKVFTRTDPEYSVADYFTAVKAKLNLNIGPAPVNMPLYQNWLH